MFVSFDLVNVKFKYVLRPDAQPRSIEWKARLLFGCDMSMTASVGRILGAEIAPRDKARILGETMERLLKRRKS